MNMFNISGIVSILYTFWFSLHFIRSVQLLTHLVSNECFNKTLSLFETCIVRHYAIMSYVRWGQRVIECSHLQISNISNIEKFYLIQQGKVEIEEVAGYVQM